MGSGVAMRGPTHDTPKVNLCVHILLLVCHSRVCIAKYHFFFLGGGGGGGGLTWTQKWVWPYACT